MLLLAQVQAARPSSAAAGGTLEPAAAERAHELAAAEPLGQTWCLSPRPREKPASRAPGAYEDVDRLVARCLWHGTQWHPEYGSYMIEGVPAQPFAGANELEYVEANMLLRRVQLGHVFLSLYRSGLDGDGPPVPSPRLAGASAASDLRRRERARPCVVLLCNFFRLGCPQVSDPSHEPRAR